MNDASIRLQRGVQRAVAVLLTVVVLAVVLFPIYWLFLNSVRPAGELLSRVPSFWTARPSFAAYARLLIPQVFLDFRVLALNTLIVCTASTFFSLVVSILAGLSLARLRFRGQGSLGMAMFLVYLIPPTLLFIPLYLLMARFGLHDTRLGLTLAYMSFNVPFCTWMLRGYFQSIPRALEESAMVDGCSRIGAWTRVVLPLAAPAIAAAGVFAFTYAWNEHLYAYILTESNASRTLSVGLAFGNNSAAAMAIAVPPFILYVAAQRSLVTGMTAGAVNG
jgi:multiple sugar transport system permease protein